MSIFARARAAMSALLVGPARPSPGSTFRHVRVANAGVHVTHETAFMVSAVWACIDAIASALASSDWNVYAGVRGSEKNKEALPEDALHRILNSRANGDMTAQSAKRALAIAAVGFGNGYAEIQWDLAGRCVGLWPISPDRVTPMRDDRGMFYRVSQDSAGASIDLDPVDMFHIRGAGLTGLVGDDPIGRAIQSIAMSVALDQFGAAYFGNGAQLGGLIKLKGNIDDAELERLSKQFNSKHGGSGNAFRVGILEGDMDFQQLTTDAEDAQLVDARNQQVEEICRWFRVPPHKVAHLLRATNNNIEHQGLEFSRDTLRPWVKEIEQEADFKLISPRGPRKFVEIDLDWASEGDFKSRIEGFAAGIASGIYSVNVVLRKLGENTIGPAGDIRMVQGAMIPLDRVGDAYAAKQ
ncbi:MAG: phage portal protein, partial [Aquincola tertiaricarbonis]